MEKELTRKELSSKEKKRYLMEEEAVGKALLKLGLPTMVGMMTSALYNLVDTFFVGRLGTAQIAAVSVAFPISLLFLAVGLLFGSGASSYLARLLGNKQYQEADKCYSTALVTAVITGVGVIACMLMGLHPLLSLLGATDTVMPYAKAYTIPFIMGLFFNVFNITMNNMIAAEGATNYSMTAMLAGGITNMILDPILIMGLHMGVFGAAMATLISRIISFALYLYYILSGKSNFHFSFHNVKPGKVLYKEIFKIGVPMLVYQILCSVAMSLTNFKAKEYGDAAVAGIGVANRILSLGAMMLTGFLKGYQPFVGFNYGAKKYDRARKATKMMMIGSTIFCVVVAIAVMLGNQTLIRLFSKTDTEVIQIGGKVLIANAITFMGMGYAMVYNFMYMALGKAKQGGVISMSRQGIFFIPLVLILPLFWGINGIIFAQPIADLCVFFVIFLMNYHKEYIPKVAMI